MNSHSNPLERLKIDSVKCSSIKPNTYNPNFQQYHEFELLLRSMRDDGFTTPIIVHEETREIIDGEHRWTALIVSTWLRKNHPVKKGEFWQRDLIEKARADRVKLLKDSDPEIPAVFINMTPEQMRVATLRHNRARGEEDVELSAAVLRDLQKLGALDWAADELMLDEDTLKRLMEDVSAADTLAGDEYGEAWDPDSSGEDADSTEATIGGTEDAPHVFANSESASRLRRERLEKLREAQTEEDRKRVMEETKIFRLNLVFSGEEAEVVTAVLGKTPAARLLELCQEAKPTMKEAAG